jgi:20S proteasome subunit beta 6
VLKTRVAAYALAHGTPISSPALSQLLATELYGRRFFPYYAFNVVAGLDSDGKGAVFTYDAVGSYERVEYAAQVRTLMPSRLYLL